MTEQKEQAEVEKSTKEFLIKQQVDQEQLERSKKEYLLKQKRTGTVGKIKKGISY